LDKGLLRKVFMREGDATIMDPMRLSYLHEEICACQLCDLSFGRTRSVPGAGPSTAEIMLIGEAPGKEEDRTGLPFMGRAGKLLDSALARAGLYRSEVFITSAIKCRPPKNRKPRKSEIDVCKPYLSSQMAILHPKVVCLMGNTASITVLGIQGVKSLRGRILQGMFLVTYHPAAVLRNRNLMDEFVSDLKKAGEVAKSFP
jgi:uracil-DNA glycosylase